MKFKDRFLLNKGFLLGAIAGFVLHFPPWAVYLILRCNTFIKTVFGLVRVACGKWQRDVTEGEGAEETPVKEALSE